MVVALGNFDGVHRGHQAVVVQAVQEALRRGTLAAVMTFHPHPRLFFVQRHRLLLSVPCEQKYVGLKIWV